VFHHPDVMGATRADFEATTVEDYWEVGASGRVYDRADIWATLDQRYNDPAYRDEWATTAFFCRELGPQTYLLTYLLLEGERVTRRDRVAARGRPVAGRLPPGHDRRRRRRMNPSKLQYRRGE
jgi:hypothetical protein